MSNIQQLRTPDVAAVLDAVRATGCNALTIDPSLGAAPIVWAIAIDRGLAPGALQRDVQEYADEIGRQTHTAWSALARDEQRSMNSDEQREDRAERIALVDRSVSATAERMAARVDKLRAECTCGATEELPHTLHHRECPVYRETRA